MMAHASSFDQLQSAVIATCGEAVTAHSYDDLVFPYQTGAAALYWGKFNNTGSHKGFFCLSGLYQISVMMTLAGFTTTRSYDTNNAADNDGCYAENLDKLKNGDLTDCANKG